jgi:hypothetical protein
MINEVKQALGQWDLGLREDTPKEILDALEPFGHVAVVPGRVDVRSIADGLLSAARYVGVYRGRSDGDRFSMRGCGMEMWLGDEDGKGDVYTTPVSASGTTFANTVRALLPDSGSVTEGTLHSVPGTFTGSFKFESPRSAITYVTDTFGTETFPVSWRVNGDGTLDAGRDEDMYVTVPVAMLVRKDPGRDMSLVGFQGRMVLDTDVEDYTTEVILLAQGEGDAIISASASQSTLYNDIHGNDLVMRRIVSESTTDATNAPARAQLQLNRFKNPRYGVGLSTDAYDVTGDFVVGDTIYVFDPDAGFIDPDNEVYWQGQPINPIALKVQEMTYPVPPEWTVGFRRSTDGVWIDLSDYYKGESGQTTITVGEFSRSLTGIGGEQVGTRPSTDTSTPATPVISNVDSVAYQSQLANDTRAALYLTWNTPLNQDGSTVLDGDHFEIRIRATETFNYTIPWNRADDFTWDELQTWGRPLSNDAADADEWKVYYKGWDENALTISELMVASEYEIQIRAVDNNNPPHQSGWSASTFHVTRTDTLAPQQPAVPEVASSQVAIQVVHRLGAAEGGVFNLALDLHHLEVHVGGPTFFPNEGTHVGNLPASDSNLRGQIPVVGSFTINNVSEVWVKVVAVDRFGNKSTASEAVQSSATLIDSEHITDLTASKITAGTINADLLMAGSIRTAEDGQRTEINNKGLQIFDENGDLTVNLTADDDEPNFIAITQGLENTVASIDQDGNISGQTITAAEDIIIAGDSFLDDLYDPLPKGIVAYASWNSTQNGGVSYTGAGANTEKGFLELPFLAQAGRRYKVTATSQVLSSVVDEEYSFFLRDGGTDTPTLSSTNLTRAEIAGGSEAFAVDLQMVYVSEFTAGVHRLLWTFLGADGTMRIHLANRPAFFMVEDTGSSVLVTDTPTINDGSGGAAPPVSNYTTDFFATWYQTYKETGAQKTDTTANQGYYSSSDGNQRSLVGFDYAAIQAALSGATITSIKLTAYAEHWYLNAGGTAVIGTHSYTSKPSTWADGSVNQNRQTSSGWPKPGSRTVTLAAAFGTDFQSGAARGIAFGPGINETTTYYGKFTGSGASRPKLTITYTK